MRRVHGRRRLRPRRAGRASWLTVSTALVALPSCTGMEGPPALEAPAALADGWEVGTPVSVGLDDAGLASISAAVAREDFGHVHALLVARRGALVFERYFHEYDGAEPHTLQSVTKSVTSALIGIALERGEIESLEGVPGETWTYNSGATILLSAALSRSTGSDAIAYATEHLFDPMGFGAFAWYRNPVDGLPHTGGGLRLLPRDLARFGQLYLDDGAWGAEQLVPKAWVDASGQVRTAVGSFGYGYQWWTKPLVGVGGHAAERSDVLFGWGYGGQHVFVSDDLDLVVVVNAWNEGGSSLGPELFDALVAAAVR